MKDYKKYGLDKLSSILTFQIKAVDVSGFVKKIGHIDDYDTRGRIRGSLLISVDFEDDFLDE